MTFAYAKITYFSVYCKHQRLPSDLFIFYNFFSSFAAVVIINLNCICELHLKTFFKRNCSEKSSGIQKATFFQNNINLF